MGIRCACGLIIPNLTSINQVPFFFLETPDLNVLGSVTVDIDACNIDLQGSFVTINFVQTSPETPDLSFTFNSTQINSVTCTTDVGVCFIQIIGSGQVEGETETRQFQFLVEQQEGQPSRIFSFSIVQFASTGPIFFPQDDVTTFGC